MKDSFLSKLLKFCAVIFLLYLFLVSINLMGHAFKGFGSDFAEGLIKTTSNPFIALFIGILATSLIQSSSTTTSIVVGMVASGTLTVPCAIPIVMGANIGTSVTNTLVSFAHITRKDEFKRAFAGALVHDIFNLSSVAILFPLELATHFLEKTAGIMSSTFSSSAAFKCVSPVKIIIKPVIKIIEQGVNVVFGQGAVISYTFMLILSFIILFISLFFIVKLMKVLVIGKTEQVISGVLGRSGILGIAMGCLFTAIVQSSSVTTSLLIPMTGAGIVSLEQIMPITLGANLGTTVTAILAALAGSEAGVTIAFVHLLFNICGIVIFYPIRRMRNFCLGTARFIAVKSAESKKYALLYVLGIFFIIPILLIFVSKLFLR